MKELLLSLWKQNQGILLRTFGKLNGDNMQFRVHPESSGAGFLFQHIAETNLAIAANAFGSPMTFKPQTLMGAKDEGQISDKAQIEALLQQAGKTIEDIISQASDQDLQTEVDTVLGKMTKWQVIGFLMHHSSHHHGQIAQALKRGFNPQAA